MIRHDATSPAKIEPRDKPVWICQCGLSRTLPICDGSHKRLPPEEPGMVYEYDAARLKIVGQRVDDPPGSAANQ